jgi:hypothetical protein
MRRWCRENQLEAEVDDFDGAGLIAVAEAGAVGSMEGREEAVGIEEAGGDRELVGLAGVAHVEHGLAADAGEGKAFGLQLGAAAPFEIGANLR